MPYVERTDEEIIAAFERWVARHPEPDRPTVSIGDKSYSPRELCEVMKSHEDDWINLELFRKMAKEYDVDPVEIIDRSGEKKDAR